MKFVFLKSEEFTRLVMGNCDAIKSIVEEAKIPKR